MNTVHTNRDGSKTVGDGRRTATLRADETAAGAGFFEGGDPPPAEPTLASLAAEVAELRREVAALRK